MGWKLTVVGLICFVAVMGGYLKLVRVALFDDGATRVVDSAGAMSILQRYADTKKITGVSVKRAQMYSYWDHGSFWGIYQASQPNEVDIIRQDVLASSARALTKPRVIATPHALQLQNTPSWWDPQSLPAADSLSIQASGSRTYWIFSASKGLIYLNREE